MSGACTIEALSSSQNVTALIIAIVWLLLEEYLPRSPLKANSTIGLLWSFAVTFWILGALILSVVFRRGKNGSIERNSNSSGGTG